MGTAQARGVAVVAATENLPVHEYTPMQVKLAYGYDHAEKAQVQEMVRICPFERVPKPDDAADAPAVAICHAHTGDLDSTRAVGGYQAERRSGNGADK